jgi:soluble lytic murein transglycosylase
VRKQGRNVIKFILGLALILILLFAFTPIFNPVIYPIKYRDTVVAEAQKGGLEPQFVAAIIRTESNFRANAKSGRGATGIMQIMPDTMEWIALKGKFKNVTTERLLADPELAIAMGTWYLHWLNTEFNGNTVVVTAAYNAGHNKVKQWLDSGIWDGRLETADNIEYEETRNYVKKVNYYYGKYKDTYPDL